VLDTGFGSLVLETAAGVIFRVARTDAAAAGHSRELKLLPALGDALRVAVPAREWRVDRSHYPLPFGAIGYRKLPGTPLSRELLGRSNEIAGDVARFLSSLHGFPVQAAERFGVPHGRSWRETLAALEAEVMPALHRLVTEDEYRLLQRWTREVGEDRALDTYRPALCHGDLWFDNFLVDGEPLRIVGVLDWEAARIGDPAQDLAPQFHLGVAFAESVLALYGSREASFRHRVRRFWELREFVGLQWAFEQDDAPELGDSLAKLRAGPILRPRKPGTR
jgi:aminoglycoside 2''-phosphotransferase